MQRRQGAENAKFRLPARLTGNKLSNGLAFGRVHLHERSLVITHVVGPMRRLASKISHIDTVG